MDKKENLLSQIKKNVISNLKNLNLAKKNREFLLDLIKLFDVLAKNENEKFINLLINLIDSADSEQKDELDIRLSSLNTQLEHSKFSEIRHFSFFSFYIKKEGVEIFIKKVSVNWDLLILEIKKIEFEDIRVTVYKSITKKEKILHKILKKNDNWDKKLIDILENNICINIRIFLNFKKV